MLVAFVVSEACCLVTDARPKRLRSAVTLSTLLVSRTRTNFSDRAFSAAGPRVWNYLPTDLRQPDLSYSHFRESLKTSPFGQCTVILFNWLYKYSILLTYLLTSVYTYVYITPEKGDSTV